MKVKPHSGLPPPLSLYVSRAVSQKVFLPHVSTPDGFTSRHLRKAKQKQVVRNKTERAGSVKPLNRNAFFYVVASVMYSESVYFSVEGCFLLSINTLSPVRMREREYNDVSVGLLALKHTHAVVLAWCSIASSSALTCQALSQIPT